MMNMKNVKFDETEKLIDETRELMNEAKSIVTDTVMELIKDGGIEGIMTIDPRGAALLAKCTNLLVKCNKLTEIGFKASKESIKNQELMDQKLNKILEFIEKSEKKEKQKDI